MRKMTGLIKRNLLIYFKDKSSVFFSMLTPILVFILYILFLKGTFVDGIKNVATGLENFIDPKDIEAIANGVLLAGILGTTLITVPFNTLTTLVKDKENNVDLDITATPMKRFSIVFSYFVASTISAFLMTGLVFLAGLLIMAKVDGTTLLTTDVIKLLGLILLGSASSTSLFMILMIFFKSSGASAAFMGLLSAAAGFVIGAYIPLSSFSEKMESVCNLFPATQLTVLIKKVILTGTLEGINDKIGGIDNGAFLEGIKNAFSLNARIFGNTCSGTWSLAYIFGMIILSVIAIGILYPKVYQRK